MKKVDGIDEKQKKSDETTLTDNENWIIKIYESVWGLE